MMMLWLLFFSVESPLNSLKLKSWFDQQNFKSINQEQFNLGSFGLFLFPHTWDFPWSLWSRIIQRLFWGRNVAKTTPKMWQNDLSTTGAKHQTFERHRWTAKRKIWKPGSGVRQFQPLARHCTVSCLSFKFSCFTYELIVYNTKYWLLIPNACGSFQSWRRPKSGAGWKTFRSLLGTWFTWLRLLSLEVGANPLNEIVVCWNLFSITNRFTTFHFGDISTHIWTPLQQASKLLHCFKTVPQSPEVSRKNANAKQHWDVSTTPEAAISSQWQTERCTHIIWSHGDLVAEVAASTTNPCILLVSLRRPSFHQKRRVSKPLSCSTFLILKPCGGLLEKDLSRGTTHCGISGNDRPPNCLYGKYTGKLSVSGRFPCHVFYSPTGNLSREGSSARDSSADTEACRGLIKDQHSMDLLEDVSSGFTLWQKDQTSHWNWFVLRVWVKHFREACPCIEMKNLSHMAPFGTQGILPTPKMDEQYWKCIVILRKSAGRKSSYNL